VVPPCVCLLSSHNITPTKSNNVCYIYPCSISIDMIELLLPCGFDTLEYSWVKATISICTLVDYSVAKKRQQQLERGSSARIRLGSMEFSEL
jgi:hypothetical protein